MEKPGCWFLQANCVKNTCGGGVTFKVKVQVTNLYLYLRYHSSICVAHILLVKTIHLFFLRTEYWCETCFDTEEKDRCGIRLLYLLDETHLEAVKGLISLRGYNQCVNKESSSECCYFVRAEQTDLLKYSAKDWIQYRSLQVP